MKGLLRPNQSITDEIKIHPRLKDIHSHVICSSKHLVAGNCCLDCVLTAVSVFYFRMRTKLIKIRKSKSTQKVFKARCGLNWTHCSDNREDTHQSKHTRWGINHTTNHEPGLVVVVAFSAKATTVQTRYLRVAVLLAARSTDVQTNPDVCSCSVSSAWSKKHVSQVFQPLLNVTEVKSASQLFLFYTGV